MDDTTKLLERIAKALEMRNGGVSELGFHNPNGTRTINIGREKPEESPWYFWNGPQGREDIKESAVTGYLKGLEMKVDGEYRGEENEKLFLLLDCGDRQYRIRTGWNSHDPDKTTVVGKSLVVAIAAMTPEQIKKPITIQVRPKGNEDPKLVFVNVYCEGQWIQAEWPSKEDWRPNQSPYLNRAIGKVQAVWGEADSTTEEEPAPRQQQAPAPRPPAPVKPPTFNAPPAPPTPAAQGARSRADILKSINDDHLRMEPTDKSIVYPLAMSAIGKGIGTKPAELTPQEFAQLVDEMLMAWADSLKTTGEGIPQLIYPDKSRQAFIDAMTLYNNPADPWKRAQCWCVVVDIERKKIEDQRSLNLSGHGDFAPAFDDSVPF